MNSGHYTSIEPRPPHNQEHFHLPNSLHASLQSKPSQLQATTDLLSLTIDWFTQLWNFYVSRIMYSPNSDFFFLSILRFIHGAEYINSLFFLNCWVVFHYMDIPSFVCWWIWGCFKFWNTMNKAVMDIHVQVFLWTLFPLSKYLGVVQLPWVST